MVLTVKGRVGLVEEGSTLASPTDLDDVRRVAAAGAFGVEGVDGAALERGHGVLHEAGLVQRVGVDGDLHVELVGHRQAVVDGGRRRAPVLVQLEPAGAGLHLLLQRASGGRVALAEKPRFMGSPSAAWIMRPICQGPACRWWRCVPSAGPVPPPSMVVTPDIQGFFDLLRADEMDMRIDAAGGHDAPFAGDRLGAGPMTMSTPGLHVRVAGLADAGDAAVAEADVGLVRCR